jgi:hypothetical protein
MGLFDAEQSTDILDKFSRIEWLLPHRRAFESLGDDTAIVSRREYEWNPLPDELVSDWVSQLVVELDVYHGHVEVILLRQLVRCV